MLNWKLKHQSVIVQTQNCIQFHFEEIIFLILWKLCSKCNKISLAGFIFGFACIFDSMLEYHDLRWHIRIYKRIENNASILHMFEAWRFKNKPNITYSLMGFPSMSQTVVLQRAHFSLNWSFIKLQNFEFEHILSSTSFYFSSLRSSLEANIPSFCQNYSSISSFIDFELD